MTKLFSFLDKIEKGEYNGVFFELYDWVEVANAGSVG